MIGQEAMLRALRNQVMSGRIGHAYLFSGPRGTGKTTLARIFARAMNCENPQDGEPCGVCPTCQALASERAMDIVEIDAASNNGVDDIRELRENVGYLPASGKYRVYIIDEVHMLSNAAFNALLKTLEEPPAHAVFILATTEVRKLLPTVLSRCQRYEFQRYSASQIAGYLGTILKDLGITVEDRGLIAIARAADGCMRDALTMLEQCLPLADAEGRIEASGVYAMLGTTDRRYYFSLSEAVLNGDAGRALAGVQMMVEMGCDPVTLASDLQRHFRDLLMVSYGQGESLGTDEQTLKQLVRQSASATPEQLLFALGLYTKLENEMRYAAMPRTYLELAVARSCTLREENLQALMARVEKLERRMEGMPSGPVSAPAAEPAAKVSEAPAEESAQESAKAAVRPAKALPEAEETDPVFGIPGPEEEPPWDEGGFSGVEEPPVFEEPIPKATAVPEAPKPVKEEPLSPQLEEKKEEPSVSGDADDAAALWKKARGLVKSPMVAAYMAQGRGKSLDGGKITVSFPPQQASARMALERERNQGIVQEALEAACGRKMRAELIEEELTERQQEFLRRNLAKLPADRVEVNFEDQ